MILTGLRLTTIPKWNIYTRNIITNKTEYQLNAFNNDLVVYLYYFRQQSVHCTQCTFKNNPFIALNRSILKSSNILHLQTCN